MTINEIKQILDTAVSDYVNRKIGIGIISERLKKINIADALSALQEEGDDETLYYLDRISDIKFYLHNETFNHHDPKNILQIIDDYYQKITKT